MADTPTANGIWEPVKEAQDGQWYPPPVLMQLPRTRSTSRNSVKASAKAGLEVQGSGKVKRIRTQDSLLEAASIGSVSAAYQTVKGMYRRKQATHEWMKVPDLDTPVFKLCRPLESADGSTADKCLEDHGAEQVFFTDIVHNMWLPFANQWYVRCFEDCDGSEGAKKFLISSYGGENGENMQELMLDGTTPKMIPEITDDFHRAVQSAEMWHIFKEGPHKWRLKNAGTQTYLEFDPEAPNGPPKMTDEKTANGLWHVTQSIGQGVGYAPPITPSQ